MVKSIKYASLLLLFFNFVLGEDNLNFNESEKKEEFTRSKTFVLKKEGDFNMPYLHVIITSKTKIQNPQLIMINQLFIY